MGGILAISDAATFAMWAVNLLVSTCIGIILWRVAQSTRRFERQEDQRNAEIAALKVERLNEVTRLEDLRNAEIRRLEDLRTQDVKELHELAGKLVDERLRAASHLIDGKANAMGLSMQAVTERLQDAESGVERMMEANHRLELKTQQVLHEVETNSLQKFVSKDDVKELAGKVDRLQQMIGNGDFVARLERASALIDQAASVVRATNDQKTGRSQR